MFTGESGEKTIPGEFTSTILEGLTPETRYQVSVHAVYGHGEGQPLAGEETTDSKSIILISRTVLPFFPALPLYPQLHILFVSYAPCPLVFSCVLSFSLIRKDDKK